MKTQIFNPWRDIPDWEGFYQASRDGVIRSVARQVPRGDQILNLKGRVLKQSWSEDEPYPRVVLNDKSTGRKVTAKVHVLVARTFLGEKPEWAYGACHFDGNPRNNMVENLRWDTQKENALDRVRHGRHYAVNKTHCPRRHPLGGSNLVPNADGRRCLACASTASWASWWKRKGVIKSDQEVQEHADMRYRKISGDF